MQDDRPSATAYRVALRRAAHQILDDLKVFDDPLALAIVGGEGETRIRSGELKIPRTHHADDAGVHGDAQPVRGGRALPRNAVLETLAFVAAQPAGSEVVFDYGRPPASLNRRYSAGPADGLLVAGGLAQVMAARV